MKGQAFEYLSLKVRFNLLITAILLLGVVLGGLLIVENNRRAVRNELRSSTRLTLGLLEATTDNLRFSAAEGPEFRRRLTRYLSALERIRHVRLQVLDSAGHPLVASATPAAVSSSGARAPGWFVRWIAPPPAEFRRPILVDGVPYGFVVVSTNPADEMAEEWLNVRDLFMVVASLFVATWVLVVWAVGQALKPVDTLLSGFDRLERGDFRARLPLFKTPELALIGRKFNRLAQTLEDTANENRRLTQRLINLQDDERRRIARELHDDLGQYLFALKTDAFAAARLAEKAGLTEVVEIANSISSLTGQMEGIVRKMIERLRPLALDELGLEDALRGLVASWRSRNPDSDCVLDIKSPLVGLSREVDTAVYYVVQESLTNIAKHAKASKVEITLRVESQQLKAQNAQESDSSSKKDATARPFARVLLVEIRDNGIGSGPERHHGMGIVGMRERVEILGGELNVRFTPGEGSSVRATIPLTTLAVIDGAREY